MYNCSHSTLELTSVTNWIYLFLIKKVVDKQTNWNWFRYNFKSDEA